MPNLDEIAWSVGNRAGALQTLNSYVRRGGTGNVLYYPGSGADVMHPLFASYSATEIMIFADVLDTLAGNIDTAIKSKNPRRLEDDEALAVATKVKINSKAAAGWIFRFKNVDRYLLLFKAGHEAFLSANKQFNYDTLFDKDFWESSDDIDLGPLLTRLRPNGFYISNNAIGVYRPFFEDLGLKYCEPVVLNGKQFVWQKIAPTPNDASMVQRAIKDARTASAGLLFDELTWGDNSPNWAPNDWVDVMAGALVEARNAISARMNLQDHIWDAAEMVLLGELENGGVFGREAAVRTAKQQAEAAYPNTDPLILRAKQLLA